MSPRNTMYRWIGVLSVPLLFAACSDTQPTAPPQFTVVDVDEATRPMDYVPERVPAGPKKPGLFSVHGPGGSVLITFTSPTLFNDPTIPGTGLAFIEDGAQVSFFWYEGDQISPPAYVFGHSHIVGGVENHHFQGNSSRQGIRIRKTDGSSFTLASIDVDNIGGSDLEVGTGPITGITGGVVDGYTTFSVPMGGVTVPISGFEDVTEVWITSQQSATWDNIVLMPPVILVDVDIKPGSDPNSISDTSNGVIPVAILGSDDFDVADIDVSTLAFGPNGAAPTHKSGGHVEDVNGDGLDDLVSHYRTQDTGLTCGDTEATVTGQTIGGRDIEGTDAVRIVVCH